MENKDNRSEKAVELRRQADDIARGNAVRVPEDIGSMPPEEIRRTLHELRVHQIELEMQNEELRRAQVELEASRARYFDLYDLEPAGYITITGEGLILDANLTAVVLLGAIRAALPGKPISRFILREDQARYYLHRQKLLETGEQQSLELRMVKKDGMVFWAQCETIVVEGEGGARVQRMVLSDITGRKKAEEAAIEMAGAKAAAEVSRIKMAEILEAHEELKRMQNMLIQAEKLSAIGTLSSGVAHELNNPLTGILGIARSYRDDKDPQDREWRDLNEIIKAGERMAKIVRGMLDFARPSTGEKEEVNCNDLIESVLDFSQKLMLGPEVDVQKTFDENLPLVKVDVNKIRQIIVNLIDNAVDAMLKKGVLKISTRMVTINTGIVVEMEFADSGCGIKAGDLGKVFDPFFTTKRPGKGTGLGLAVAQSIIKQHGGDISVESPRAGQDTGTSFKVRLPVICAGDAGGGGDNDTLLTKKGEHDGSGKHIGG